MPVNMKTYLPTLLLFFLLVDKSVSPPTFLGKLAKDRLVKQVAKKIAKEAAKEIIEDWYHKFIDPPPPPGAPAPAPSEEIPLPPSGAPAPPEEIPGLSRLVRKYLSNYGYIQSDHFTEVMDSEMTSALKSYQHFFNLTETGYLDEETLQQMTFLRCAVPDKNVTYGLSASNNVSWPLGTEWFLFPNRKNLTYGFLPANDIPAVMIDVFRDSFKRWSVAIGPGVLNLTETAYEAADITIGFYNFSGIMDANVVGGSIIVRHAGDDSDADKVIGAMLLDASKYWLLPTDNATSLSWEDGEVDLSTVAMHQIGHLLGLSHSSHNASVMYPYILPSNQRQVELSDDDRDQIKQVYFASPSDSGGGRVTLLGSRSSGWGLLTAFSLGFACMVLSY